MARLEGKIAIVTGAANGMGASHARRLVDEGASVLITDVNAEAGAELAEELGSAATFQAQDVASEVDWAKVMTQVTEEFGGLDILVNNAGLFNTEGFSEASADTLRKVLDVNVVGTWIGIQQAAPLMRKRGGGSIINIASLVALRGMPNYSIYGGSKWAVRGITRHAAAELGPDGIRVNAILPGAIDHTGMFNSADVPELESMLLETTPLRSFGSPGDVSSLVVYLASDESRFTTGADHLIDGGRGI